MAEDIVERIRRDVREHPVVIYMKGTPEAPRCGFSAQAVHILSSLGVGFESRDVLAQPGLRDAVKRFSSWPTIPQVYVGGELLGGCDLVSELHETGELAERVRKALGA